MVAGGCAILSRVVFPPPISSVLVAAGHPRSTSEHLRKLRVSHERCVSNLFGAIAEKRTSGFEVTSQGALQMLSSRHGEPKDGFSRAGVMAGADCHVTGPVPGAAEGMEAFHVTNHLQMQRVDRVEGGPRQHSIADRDGHDSTLTAETTCPVFLGSSERCALY